MFSARGFAQEPGAAQKIRPVIGTLPFHLAKRALSVTAIPLRLSQGDRDALQDVPLPALAKRSVLHRIYTAITFLALIVLGASVGRGALGTLIVAVAGAMFIEYLASG